ncbi:MAG: diacylglycerol kinase family protein [Candidatus Paceibacterota bacterium]|nr:diacylglycerol kinase family protein [Patescibacteria group bacterium]
MFSLLESFSHAFKGLVYVFKSERNFRIQTLAALITACLAVYFSLKAWEIITLILLILLVMIMEIINTALEYFSDMMKPRLHHYVEVVKDMMAGGVLLSSIGSIAIGVIIFLPRLMDFFKSL